MLVIKLCYLFFLGFYDIVRPMYKYMYYNINIGIGFQVGIFKKICLIYLNGFVKNFTKFNLDSSSFFTLERVRGKNKLIILGMLF